jgi:hypothetical protein
MMTHSKIQSQLYDYLSGALAKEPSTEVEQHLAKCRRCSLEAEDLRVAMAVVPRPEEKPSAERPEHFWVAFANQVEQSIAQQQVPAGVPKVSFLDYLRSALVYQRRSLVAIGSGLAIVAAVVVVRQVSSPPVDEGFQTLVEETQELDESRAVNVRFSRYLRTSKILMVGLMNMKTDDSEPIDLSVERELSRELVREARVLSQMPLDERAMALIRDLEKILIELANIEEEYDLPDVEILRAGIKQENLLFKLRMGESQYRPNGTERTGTTSMKGESS